MLRSARMLARRREAWTLIAALCLHAAAIGALRLASSQSARAPRLSEAAAGADLAWDIDLGADVRSPAENPSVRPEPSLPAPARPALRPRAAEPSALVAEQELEAPPVADAVENATAAPAADTRQPIDLGISADGWQRWVGPPGEQHAARGEPRVRSNRFQVYRAPPVSTTGGVQEGLEKRDLELGLGPSGRVLSALHHTAHESLAPAAGTATFEVTVLRSGAVEVRLGSASAQTEEWRGVAKRIAERLRAAPPRIAPPRQGARFVVELVAEETMPSGVRMSELKGPHLDAVPLKLYSTEDAQKQLELDNPTAGKAAEGTPQPPIKLDLPGVYLAERGRVCSYRLGLSAFGPTFQGSCDPSQIGAKPLRRVRARVLEQSMF